MHLAYYEFAFNHINVPYSTTISTDKHTVPHFGHERLPTDLQFNMKQFLSGPSIAEQLHIISIHLPFGTKSVSYNYYVNINY